MPSLNSTISFDVRFLLTGTPAIQLTVSTTLTSLEKVDLKGYFTIVQPDCISETGNYVTPDISWNGTALNVFTKTLRLGTDQLFQKGNYSITFFADHPSYTPGSFTRTFNFSYLPAEQSILEDFDLYTPKLQYVDNSVYTKGDYTIVSQSSAWSSTSPAGVITPATTSIFDIAISGNYYDSTYNTTYTKTVLYSQIANAWLTVLQGFTYAVISKSYIPQSTSTLLTYLGILKTEKDANQCSNSLEALYEKASVLHTHIRNKVCARDTPLLKEYFDEFYRLTHHYQNYVYANTGGIIPAYDFATGCGGGSGSGLTASVHYTATTNGVTVIPISIPATAHIIQIIKEIKPLKASEYSYSAPNITLLGGLELAMDETLYVMYNVTA